MMVVPLALAASEEEATRPCAKSVHRVLGSRLSISMSFQLHLDEVSDFFPGQDLAWRLIFFEREDLFQH